MKNLFIVLFIIISNIVATAQTIVVTNKNGRIDTFDASKVDSVTFQKEIPGFTIYTNGGKAESPCVNYSFDNVVNILGTPNPYVKTVDGTDILSFALTDGVNYYQSFAISDSVVYVTVPNQANMKELKACFTHNGNTVTCNGVEQKSGQTVGDFSNFVKPLIFRVESIEGKYKDYTIRLFDIPVAFITTNGRTPIYNKVDWVPASIRLIDTDGSVLLSQKVNIKGRGNASWERYPKKSYSLKFDKGVSFFDIPKGKRWVILGTASDWTKLRTPLCFKYEELTGMEWSPRGQNVEFILNDSLLCNYYLCEQVRVGKNRINIQEMTPSDTIGEAVTGGVLFEVDRYYDEEFKFKAEISGLPFMLKNPDKNVQEKQLAYFTSYINKIESILYSNEDTIKNTIIDYLDFDSYIRWWLVSELTLDIESTQTQNNFFMYKDRGYNSKLYAGPVWDFDWGTFWKYHLDPWLSIKNGEAWICKEVKWFKQLFSNDLFVERVKTIWTEIQPNLKSSITDFFEKIKIYNKNSVLREQFLFPKTFDPDNIYTNNDSGMDYDAANTFIREVIESRIEWLDKKIRNM